MGTAEVRRARKNSESNQEEDVPELPSESAQEIKDLLNKTVNSKRKKRRQFVKKKKRNNELKLRESKRKKEMIPTEEELKTS